MMDVIIRSWDRFQSKSGMQKAGVVSAITIGSLVAYNIRWKYLLGGRGGARKLPFVKREAGTASDIKLISVVLLPGMWHTPSCYEELQICLAKEGFTSYAVDFVPGERFHLRGASMKQLIADLEYTLEDIPAPYILMGHSQGGLVVQGALQHSSDTSIRKNTEGIVMMASFPLGHPTPIRLFMDDLGTYYSILFGKIMNARFAKKLNLLPTTDEKSPELSTFIQKLLKAPPEGRITMSLATTGKTSTTPSSSSSSPLDIPALILSPKQDALCDPTTLRQAFDERFSNATHVLIPNQGHAFRDPGWQTTMIPPLVKWLEDRVPDVI
eukprot:scaffold1805_cov104-Cylindrotheca_fusiformis.AAC.13